MTSSQVMNMGWAELGSLAASAVMVLGGALPYVPQYQQIRSTGNAEGFSLLVPFVLIVANTLRVFFWCGVSGLPTCESIGTHGLGVQDDPAV
jgi:hypothetical protein